ncbi:hypothetical protein CSZ94_04410 [Janthinobacterium sp. ROICE36]|uniref:hypothetical protein n=1 Tax=Janthinobacterium sp. ROICE36 TaxID=2048670 RepID=UPI000C7F4426|nr:hypothetical protein [Janthinobacterium sp. ROICE36]PLY45838.1 hypothetical protein CSZ94_04410 [Janthinobacterium sp. ROICE36]
MPRTPALKAAAYAMLKHADAAPAFVLSSGNLWHGGRPKIAALPGAGLHFRDAQRIPTLHYFSGPAYLLNYGVSTVIRLEYQLMQRETVALTQMLPDLSRVPYADLRKETAP